MMACSTPTKKLNQTCDHSDIYSIINSNYQSNHPSNQHKSPKRIRVALMDGNTCLPPNNNHSTSPNSSQSNSPHSRRPLKRVLSRVLSSGSSSSLFASQPIIPIVQPCQPTIDLKPSTIAPQHQPINSNHLANLFASIPLEKKTYGSQRSSKPQQIHPSSSSSSTPASCQDSLNLIQTSPTITSSKDISNRFKNHESYDQLRQRWGIDQDDDTLLNQPEIHSILHQRSSGSSKRFTDGLLYLIEGLSPRPNQKSDLNLKRLNAIEFIAKFKDHTFLDQLRNGGLVEQFYNSFRSAGAGDGDPILDHALLIFISAMCCSDQKFIEPILRILPKDSSEVYSVQSDCLQVLARFVTRSPPPFQPSSNTTSTAKSSRTRSRLPQSQLLTSQIQQVIQESILNKFLSGSSSSTLLSLFSLARIAMFSPRPGLLPQRLIVQSGAFVSVINCLKTHNHNLRDRFKNSYPDREFSETRDEVEQVLKHVGYCVDVIEACTVCYEEEAVNLVDSFKDPLVFVFSNLIETGHFLAACDHSKISMRALDISIGCIRTMVNITNFNSVWADQLSTSSLFEALFGFFKICRSAFEDFDFDSKIQKRGNCREKPGSNLSSSDHPPQQPKSEQKINDEKMNLRSRPKRKQSKEPITNFQKADSLIPSSSFLQPSKVEDGSKEGSEGVDQVVFDLLCVTLALLANLLEQSSHAKKIFEEIRLPTHALEKREEDVSISAVHRENHFPPSDHLSGPPFTSVTTGFEELMMLYAQPPSRHSDEKKFIRGSICVLINFLLLDDPQADNTRDHKGQTDDNQTENEVKIIHSFNSVFGQAGFDRIRDEASEVTEETKKKQDYSKDKVEEEEEEEALMKLKSEEGRKDWPTKNSMVTKFIEDLKIHSNLGISPISLNYHHTYNHPSSLPNQSTHHYLLPTKSRDLTSSLLASWDRLRVGLI